MPNRVLKESIKRSPQIDNLSWFEEVVFYRLLVTVDDFGCTDGRLVLLKNELFPTRDNISKDEVAAAIEKLERSGLIMCYEVEGRPFLYLPTWDKHQRIRNKHRKCPEPPTDDCGRLSADCGQTPASCPSESNPIQSESESKSESKGRASRFSEFWDAYPKKKSKGDAEKAWNKISPDEALFRKIMCSIEQQKKTDQWSKNDGKYIPYPATWLRAQCWEDEEIVPNQQKYDYGDPEDFYK